MRRSGAQQRTTTANGPGTRLPRAAGADTPARLHGKDARPGSTRRELSRGSLPGIQRARMLSALVEVAGERGLARTTVAQVIARSGVSRRTFYETFADLETCILAVVDDAAQRATQHIHTALQNQATTDGVPHGLRTATIGRSPASRPPSSTAARRDAGDPADAWCGRIRCGLLAMLELLDEQPELARLCLIDTSSAGEQLLQRRAEIVAGLVEELDAGRAFAQPGFAPSWLAAEGVLGGVLTVLCARLSQQPGHVSARVVRRPLVGLLNPLMSMIVLPYLGPQAAARELARPAPKARRRPPRAPSNPLQGLDMRLTYRTVRALVAVAEQPMASNREIADAAGVQDQGQISKLLTRLEHLGLLENHGAGNRRGRRLDAVGGGGV